MLYADFNASNLDVRSGNVAMACTQGGEIRMHPSTLAKASLCQSSQRPYRLASIIATMMKV